MAVTRWLFDDPVTFDSYTFELNPVEGGTPGRKKSYTSETTTGGNTIIFEGTEEAREGEFSGVILTQDMYEKMVEWFEKTYPINVTDDLGRTFSIYITGFDPRRERAVHSPWKHSYTVRYVVLGES